MKIRDHMNEYLFSFSQQSIQFNKRKICVLPPVILCNVILEKRINYNKSVPQRIHSVGYDKYCQPTYLCCCYWEVRRIFLTNAGNILVATLFTKIKLTKVFTFLMSFNVYYCKEETGIIVSFETVCGHYSSLIVSRCNRNCIDK